MKAKSIRKFDPKAFLATIGEGRKILTFEREQPIFAQGGPTDAVFYVQKGKVKLTVVSQAGKEATVGVLGDGSFFGEGGLAGQALRMGSASAMTDCTILRIDKKSMIDALHREHTFSDLFVSHLLARNIRYEEDLVDQLFNSSEKRLARILLLLAHFGKEGTPETVIPKISQESLAEMVGTTRSRVSFFMNRFRKLGFVAYDGNGMQVHSSLLNVSSARLSSQTRNLPASCSRMRPLDRRKLADQVRIAFLHLLIPTRQANRTHLGQVALSCDFGFTGSEGSRDDRAVAFVARIGRDVKILGFHDEFPHVVSVTLPSVSTGNASRCSILLAGGAL